MNNLKRASRSWLWGKNPPLPLVRWTVNKINCISHEAESRLTHAVHSDPICSWVKLPFSYKIKSDLSKTAQAQTKGGVGGGGMQHANKTHDRPQRLAVIHLAFLYKSLLSHAVEEVTNTHTHTPRMSVNESTSCLFAPTTSTVSHAQVWKVCILSEILSGDPLSFFYPELIKKTKTQLTHQQLLHNSDVRQVVQPKLSVLFSVTYD